MGKPVMNLDAAAEIVRTVIAKRKRWGHSAGTGGYSSDDLVEALLVINDNSNADGPTASDMALVNRQLGASRAREAGWKARVTQMEEHERDMRNTIAHLQETVSEYKTAVESAQQQRDQYIDRLNELEIQLRDQVQEKLAAAQNVAGLVNENRRLQQTIDALRGELAEFEKAVAVYTARHDDVFDWLNTHVRECEGCDGELTLAAAVRQILRPTPEGNVEKIAAPV